jgi:hypothetical protein
MKDVRDQTAEGLPPQHQARQPGREGPMRPRPDYEPLDAVAG